MTAIENHLDNAALGDRIDRHVDLATDHATRAVAALTELEETAIQERRGKVLNQRIGVHVKLAGVHADLALALAQSTAQVVNNISSSGSVYTPPSQEFIKARREMLVAAPDSQYL